MNTENSRKRFQGAPLEKISLNLPVSELGRIDALIEAGITTNRTEFIRNAVRKELGNYEEEIEAIAPRRIFAMGIIHLSKKDVELAIKKQEKLKIRVIGYLKVAKEITPDDLYEAVHSCRVYGTISAPKLLKQILVKKKPRYSLLGREYQNNLLEEEE
ncbi:MAG: ribbon-helix-helix protein, CopG family [Promethearchaeota archaeon]